MQMVGYEWKGTTNYMQTIQANEIIMINLSNKHHMGDKWIGRFKCFSHLKMQLYNNNT